MAYVKEIFTSVQGEGPFVGYKQLFIRFCRCNLNCSYCDTAFDLKGAVDYSVEELAKICNKNKDCQSVSLTGGEPLLEVDFIKKLASKIKLPIYLETNGTLYRKLAEIIDVVEYVAADIKIDSSTHQKANWEHIEQFLKIASAKCLFVKVVFDSEITDKEINKITSLSKKYGVELTLQPMMIKDKPSVDSEFMLQILDKCLKKYKRVRLIPQMQKLIGVN